MAIFQIGELVNHMPTDYLEKTKNEISWDEIRGMRNRFAHGYMNMDFDIIYKVAINDIPTLSRFIENELIKMNKEYEENQ